MTRISSRRFTNDRICRHPRLRALDYDESYHWVVACPDCDHVGSMTQSEWGRLLADRLPTRVSDSVVIDELDSGRVDRPR